MIALRHPRHHRLSRLSCELSPRLPRLSRQLSTSAHTWQSIRSEAESQISKFDAAEKTQRSFGIRHFIGADVLAHDSLASALSTTVGDKLAANSTVDHVDYRSILMSAFETKPDICDAVAADIERFKVIDPACDGLLGVYLFYKGVHALACARVANHYWEERGETGRLIARLLQSEMADVFGQD